MREIKILGTGCPKCEKLRANAETAVAEMGIECEIIKVKDINDILAFGVMMTPAIVLDGKVESVGKLLSSDDIKKLLAT